MFSFTVLRKRSLSLLLSALLLLSSAYVPSEQPAEQSAPASAGACQTSNGPNNNYQVTVCLTQPANGATVTGVQTVSATVTVTGSSPGVQRAIFYLDNQYLLIDYAAAYTFQLPTDRFVDGNHLLQMEALMRDGFTSARTGLTLLFNNGVTQPPVNTRTFTPSKGSTPASGEAFVLATVGDGAGGETNETLVTNLIDSWDPNLLLYLGDVYEKGMLAEFYNWYGTSASTTFYGRFRPITNPAIGNHEYENGIAPGYFDYWDNVPNYYSFNTAGWHFISLNSTSQFNQTSPASAQYVWLAQDLQANTAQCTIVFFHHPVYNLGPQGDTTRMNPMWALFAQRGVDIVLTAHDHNYQRWYPLNGQAVRDDSSGVTQFVVGTGGHGLQRFVRSDSRAAKGIDNTYGALRLKLYSDRAEFKFGNTAGTTLDSGTVDCVNAPPPATPTRTPTGPTPTLTPTPAPPTNTPTRTNTPSGPTPTPSRTPTVPPSGNVVQNPSFEIAGLGGAADAANWTEGTNHARASDKFNTGAWSLKSTFTSSGSVYSSQTVSVQPNTPYIFSIYFWNGATNLGSGTCADLSDISDETQLCASLTGTWEFKSGTWDSGSNTSVTLRLITDGTPNAGSWFDDVSLTGPGASTPTRTHTPPGPTATPTQTLTPAPQTLTFTPVADTYVSAGHPDSNYGDLNELHVDASPIRQGYLRFDVQGVSGAVTQATLRLFTLGSSSLGYAVHSVGNNTWNETTITYNTAPPIGSASSSSGAFSTGTWVTVNITPMVSGNGLVSFALATSDTNTLILASREAGANAPQLVIQTN